MASVAAVCLSPAVVLNGPGAAQAVVGDLVHGISVSGVVSYGTSEFGSFDGPGADVMWCVQLGAKAPTAAQLKGVKATSVSVPRIAYLITRYKNKAAAGHTLDGTHAAISYLQHAHYDKGYGAVTASARRKAVEAWFEKNRASVWKLGQNLWDEAGRYAGAYTAKAGLKTSVAGGKGAGTLTASLVSAAGKTTPGMSGAITLSGPAAFGNGSRSKTFTSGTTPSTWTIDVTGTGTVTAKVAFSGLPGTTVNQYDAGSSRQTMWTDSTTASVSASASGTLGATPLTVSTSAGVQYSSAASAVIRDTISVKGPASLAGLNVPVTARAYWAGLAAPAQRASTSGGTAEAVGQPVTVTGRLDASGAVTLPVQTTSSKGAGYYTWVVSTPTLLGGIVPAYTSPFAVPSETVRVTASPLLRTQIDKQVVDEKAGLIKVRDQVFVTGANPGQKLTVTVVPYGPLTADPSTHPATVAPSGTPKLPTQTITITANSSGAGSTLTPWVDVPQPPLGETRWVTFVASFPATTNVSSAYASRFGDPAETTSVTRSAPGVPVISTIASTERAKAGETISDTLIVTPNDALLGQYPLRITSRLWRLSTQPVPGQSLPDDAVMVQQRTLEPINETGPEIRLTAKNKYTIPDEFDGMGWWVYTYSYPQGGDPDVDGYPAVDDETVHAEETVLVPWQPRAATTASDSRVRAGDTLSDHLVVRNGRPGSTVTVVSLLFGPLPAAPKTAVLPPLTDLEPVFTTETEIQIGADGNGTADTAPSDPLLGRGFYTWWTGIALDPGGTWPAWTDTYGLPAETSVVEWEPEVITRTSDQVATVGDELTDTLEVTGLPPGTSADVVSTLWVVPADRKVVESDDVPPDAVRQGAVATTVTSDADGTARGFTEAVTLTDPGHAVWTETITPQADDLFRAWHGRWGAATEITDVFDVTTTAQTSCAVGRAMTDVAHVAGAVPPGSTLVFKAYEQGNSEDPDDDPLVATTHPVTVTEAGDYTSPAVPCEKAATYYWREELTPPGDETPRHVGGPRLPNESTTSVSVVTTATSATLGGPIQDTAQVIGAPPPGSYLVFRAYRLEDGVDPETVDPDSLAASFESEHVPVTGPGRYSGTPFTPKQATSYLWVETLYDRSRVRVHTGVLGAEGETSTIAPPGTTPPGTTVPRPSTPPKEITTTPRLAFTGTNVRWYLGGAGVLIAGGAAAAWFTGPRRRA